MERHKKKPAVVSGEFGRRRINKHYLILGAIGIVLVGAALTVMLVMRDRSTSVVESKKNKVCPTSMFRNVQDGAKLAAEIKAKPNYQKDLDCVYYLANYNSKFGKPEEAKKQIEYLEQNGGDDYDYDPALTSTDPVADEQEPAEEPTLDELKQSANDDSKYESAASGEITGQE